MMEDSDDVQLLTEESTSLFALRNLLSHPFELAEIKEVVDAVFEPVSTLSLPHFPYCPIPEEEELDRCRRLSTFIYRRSRTVLFNEDAESRKSAELFPVFRTAVTVAGCLSDLTERQKLSLLSAVDDPIHTRRSRRFEKLVELVREARMNPEAQERRLGCTVFENYEQAREFFDVLDPRNVDENKEYSYLAIAEYAAWISRRLQWLRDELKLVGLEECSYVENGKPPSASLPDKRLADPIRWERIEFSAKQLLRFAFQLDFLERKQRDPSWGPSDYTSTDLKEVKQRFNLDVKMPNTGRFRNWFTPRCLRGDEPYRNYALAHQLSKKSIVTPAEDGPKPSRVKES